MLKQKLKRAIGETYLRAFGWRPEGERPADAFYVLIAAPHTSNWDLPFTLALSYVFDVQIRWMGKHTLFEGPLGPLMRALGGVPVERHHRNNLVQQMAALFEEHKARGEPLTLLVATEGTRARTESWKSGFYRIAEAAQVPIVMGYLDFEKKRGGFGPPLQLSGDIARDMDKIRAFYADKIGKKPENFGPIRLKIEAPNARAVA